MEEKSKLNKEQAPNAETLAALLEVEQMKAAPESCKGFLDVDEMIKEVFEK